MTNQQAADYVLEGFQTLIMAAILRASAPEYFGRVVALTNIGWALNNLFGLVLGLPFAVAAAGGVGFFRELPPVQLTWTGGLTPVQLLGYSLPVFVLILGEQNMYQRFASARDGATAKRANVGFFLGNIVVVSLVTILCSAAVAMAVLQHWGWRAVILVGAAPQLFDVGKEGSFGSGHEKPLAFDRSLSRLAAAPAAHGVGELYITSKRETGASSAVRTAPPAKPNL